MGKGTRQLIYFANKVFVFDSIQSRYIWYILKDKTILEEYDTHGGKLSLVSSLETNTIDNFTIIDRVISLLINDYEFGINKNRNSFYLNPKVIKKFRTLLKRYYGVSVLLNNSFKDFLKCSIYDEEEDTKEIMEEINRFIINLERR